MCRPPGSKAGQARRFPGQPIRCLPRAFQPFRPLVQPGLQTLEFPQILRYSFRRAGDQQPARTDGGTDVLHDAFLGNGIEVDQHVLQEHDVEGRFAQPVQQVVLAETGHLREHRLGLPQRLPGKLREVAALEILGHQPHRAFREGRLLALFQRAQTDVGAQDADLPLLPVGQRSGDRTGDGEGLIARAARGRPDPQRLLGPARRFAGLRSSPGNSCGTNSTATRRGKETSRAS